MAEETKVPKDLEDRIKRGRERLEKIATSRDEAWAFYRGDHYAYVDSDNKLQFLATTTSVRLTGKPPHRARQKRNLIFDHVLRQASSASQRAPFYEVVPATSDPSAIGAAALAEKVALWGFDRWGLRRTRVEMIVQAIVGGEAFAWPYFDNTIGPFIQGEKVGEGDVRVQIFGGNECYWEPGLRFPNSPWHAIEQARPISQVTAMEGYFGGTLSPDASTRQLSGRGKSEGKKRLVLVTEYLERPSPARPEGRWVVMANQRKVVPDRPYPGDGEDPCLRYLSYAPDPDSDRDLGLVPQLLDAQRTHNDANNKAVEIKNHYIMPRLFVAPGVMKRQRFTDEPGKVYEIPQPEQNVKFLETAGIPSELFEMIDRAEQDMGRIAAQNDIPSQVSAAQAVQALQQSDLSRMGMFIAALAECDAKIMHDCLGQVQEHYTEPRLIKIKGDFGWESIEDFRGAQLRDQTDVKVATDSIEPRSKAAIEQRVMNYAQLGWIGPDEAMAAIDQGTAEVLTRSLAADEARAGRIIQRIKNGPEALFGMPDLPTGDPSNPGAMAPGWMPRYSDNLTVFRSMFEDWMKTEAFERLDPGMQEATANIYAGVLQLEAQKQAQAAAAQTAQAEQYGMQNAAAPQGNGKPNPSFPSQTPAQ
jgi:hypothetical protein